MRSINKKGQLGTLQGIVLSLVIIGILLAAAFLILSEFKSEVTSDTAATHAIGNTTAALSKIPSMLGLIVLIAVIGIILAIVFNVIPGARQTTSV